VADGDAEDDIGPARGPGSAMARSCVSGAESEPVGAGGVRGMGGGGLCGLGRALVAEGGVDPRTGGVLVDVPRAAETQRVQRVRLSLPGAGGAGSAVRGGCVVGVAGVDGVGELSGCEPAAGSARVAAGAVELGTGRGWGRFGGRRLRSGRGAGGRHDGWQGEWVRARRWEGGDPPACVADAGGGGVVRGCGDGLSVAHGVPDRGGRGVRIHEGAVVQRRASVVQRGLERSTAAAHDVAGHVVPVDRADGSGGAAFDGAVYGGPVGVVFCTGGAQGRAGHGGGRDAFSLSVAAVFGAGVVVHAGDAGLCVGDDGDVFLGAGVGAG